MRRHSASIGRTLTAQVISFSIVCALVVPGERLSGRGSSADDRGRIDRDERTGAAAVLSHFLRLARLDAARWSARVDTAAPLDAADRAALEALLAERYGRGIEAAFALDPALIGGMRLGVGSDVYDGSVRARLAALDRRF